jgi:hypothetical protein
MLLKSRRQAEKLSAVIWLLPPDEWDSVLGRARPALLLILSMLRQIVRYLDRWRNQARGEITHKQTRNYVIALAVSTRPA